MILHIRLFYFMICCISISFVNFSNVSNNIDIIVAINENLCPNSDTSYDV